MKKHIHSTERGQIGGGFRLRWSIVALALSLLAVTASANDTYTWDFTDENGYEFSDPDLIRVNTDDGGRAELILQETMRGQSSLDDYLEQSVLTGVRVGSEQVLELKKDTNDRYLAPGVYRSRVLDRGQGSGNWDAMFTRTSNAQLQNSPPALMPGDPDLKGLFRFDGSVTNEVTQNPATQMGGTLSYLDAAIVGSHAANFQRGQGYLVVPRSDLDLTGARAVTFSYWARPSVQSGNFGNYLSWASGNSRLFVGHDRTTQRIFLAFRNVAGAQTDIIPDVFWPLNTWTFVTLVWEVEAGRVRLYFDKDLVLSEQVVGGHLMQQLGDLHIGTDGGTPSRQVDSYMDELSIWSRALTEDEIGALIDNQRSVRFRLRSSSTGVMSGDFVGPDGTPDSFYLGIADRLASAGGNFTPIHRYLQYEARLFTDGDRRETPQLQYVKFTTRDGRVRADSTSGDFRLGQPVQSVTNAPYVAYTPYLGLTRAPNGGFRTSGSYTSGRFDAGVEDATWDQLLWRVPIGIDNEESGLMALYNLDGSWGDTASATGIHDPTAVNNPAFSGVPRLGANAALFSEDTGGSTVSNFFSTAQSIATLSFWIRADRASDGLLELGEGAVLIRDHQVVTDGFGALSPQVYVNANPQSAYLRSGWNHVALVFPSAIQTTHMLIGRARGDYFNGMLDELALYTVPLTMGQVQVQFYNAHPISSGTASFRVRASNLPDFSDADWSLPFADPGVGFTENGRYFQYQALFSGDGSDTPVVGNVRALGNDGVNTFAFATDTLEEAARGVFDGTAWYGDEIYVENFAATDPSNLQRDFFTSADVLAGLWHFDEPVWETGTVLTDSSGAVPSRPGSPRGGAQSSPNARVGFRSGAFDGVDSFVDLPQIPELSTNNFSVGLWFNSRDTNEGSLISTFTEGGPYFELVLNHDGFDPAPGRVAFVLNDGDNGVRSVVSPAENLNNGTWRHVVGVRAASYIHLYIDGVRVATTYMGSFKALNAASPRVMRNGDGNRYLSGFVDEVVIFGSALSPQRVGTVFATGYSTRRINPVTFAPVDAGGPTIWQSLRWTTDGLYGLPMQDAPSIRGLWHLDETSGTIAQDASDSGLDGDYIGTVPAEGVFDGARFFNGISDRMVIPHDNVLQSPTFSLTLWVNPVSLNNRVLLDKRNGNLGYGLFTDGIGRLNFQVSTNLMTTALPLLQNEWSHIAASYDGTSMRLYINGELRGTHDAANVNLNSGVNLFVGQAAVGGGRWQGRMDEIAYHNRRLLDTEIMDLYRAGTGILKFQVRSSESLPMSGDFYGPDQMPDTYFVRGMDNNLVGVVPLQQFLQVRAYIGTEDHRFSPTFYGLSVSASRYPENAPWVAPTTANAFEFLGNLLDFDHTRTYDVNETTKVRYQISGDPGLATTNRWFYFTAGQWVEKDPLGPAIYEFQTSDFATVATNIGTFYEQVYDKTGGVFRFKAFLKSEGDQQVAVSNVTVEASRGRVTVVSPNGAERGRDAWIAAVPYEVEWSWAGVVSDNLEVSYSEDGYDGPWEIIASGVERGDGGTNSVTWVTPQPPSGESTLSNVVVRVRDLDDDTIVDWSDAPFEITQRFKVVTPNGGERWYIGETNSIRWESAHQLSTRVSIFMAADGENFIPDPFDPDSKGYVIEPLATNINASADNVYHWATPRNVADLLSTNAKVLIQAPNGLYADDSDDVFSMVGIVVTRPRGGQNVRQGDLFDIEWRSMSAGNNVHIDISLDGGDSYQSNLFSNVQNQNGDNTRPWNVVQPEANVVILRVRSLEDNRIIGYSEPFTIAGIDITSPSGGEEWLAGTTQEITWTAGGVGNTVSIYYTDLFEGANTVWEPITLQTPNTLSYNWTVSDRVSPFARIRIVSDEDPELFAISAQNFNIAGVKVTYPNSFSDTLIMGNQYQMTHAGAPMRWLRVSLEISYDREENWQLLGPAADDWTLRQPFPFRPTRPSRQTKVRATVLGATDPDGLPLTNVVDVSDEYFTVEGILMEAPLAGEIFTLGDNHDISWVSAGAGTAATILYSSGNDGFIPIAPGVFNNQAFPGNNDYSWQVPTTLRPSANARIRVISGNYQADSEPFVLRGIRVTNPTQGLVVPIGSQTPLGWTFAGMDPTASGSISLSLDGGQTFEILEPDYELISVPFYNWQTDPDLDPTTNALIRLEVLDSAVTNDIEFIADSDRFTLKGIKILSPETGGVVQHGETNTIEFIAAAAGQTARIDYSADGGNSWDATPIVQNLSIVNGLNSFEWTVESTRTPSTNAAIRIVGTQDEQVSGTFTLAGIRVDRPMVSDIWAVGDNTTIEWVAQVDDPVFNIHLLYEDGFEFLIAQNVPGSIHTNYVLTAAALRNQATISNVVLRVRDRGQDAVGLSAPFRLVSKPIIEVVSPSEGEFLRVGDEVQVTWIKGGSMDKDDFSVWFSRDDFATPPEDIGRDVTFNPADNTFSMPWLIPDRIGRTQIMVTNSVNTNLVAFSGEFDIVGSFDLQYPRGAPGEDPVYANDIIPVNWFTEGTVEEVNVFYKIDGKDWKPANAQPINNNPRTGRYQSFYQWTAPIVHSDNVLLRVQDARFPDPELFDGTKIGPYSQSPDPFALNFYTVTWDVRYRHQNEDGTFTNKPLDKLSVTDSSGWSVTGLESPFTTNYPAGTFDTVWYRQFFNDKVDFRWTSDRDQTRSLLMLPSDTEPDAYVLATFSYNPGKETLTIHSWIERGGRVLFNPDSTTIHIFDTDGQRLKQMTETEVRAEGFFRLQWENVLDEFITPGGATAQMQEGETYLARVEVMYNRVIYSAAVTYTLSLAPEFEQVQSILDRVSSLETNIAGRVDDLTDLTTDFRDRAMTSLGTIEQQTGSIATNMQGISEQIGDFRDTVVQPLSMLTNQMVEVLGPTLTNMAQQVEDIAEATAGEQARILNRPTTVEYGTTNAILFRTTSGRDVGQVRLTVEGVGMMYNMRELSGGIYSADVVANWGLGPFMISCVDRVSGASDRVILEVVASGASSIGALMETVMSLESQMTSMAEITQLLADPTVGLEAMLTGISAEITQVETALGAAIGGVPGAPATEAVAALESLLIGEPAEGTAMGALMSGLAGMSGRIEEIFGSSSDASRLAQGARTAAENAASGVRQLQALLEGEYSLEAAMGALDTIRSSVDAANERIENIPQAMGTQALHAQLQTVADQISEMAALAGYEYEVAMAAPGVPGVEPGEVADEEIITTLNQNMNEVKISLEFMQRVLDDKLNEPVVMESWLGVE